MTKPTNEMPVTVLADLFVYDPEAGLLFWRRRYGREAWHVMRDGYRVVAIEGVRYAVHRVIWAMTTGHWPANEIDHIDGDKLNNRLPNMREATRAQNSRNRPQPRTSVWPKGVSRGARDNFRAQITVNGRQIRLGTFSTVEAAHLAYRAAAERYHGEFAKVA